MGIWLSKLTFTTVESELVLGIYYQTINYLDLTTLRHPFEFWAMV